MEYVNTAVMTGLEDGKSYKYYVGDFPFFSEHIEFVANTAQSYDSVVDKPYTFAVVADWGLGLNGQQSLDLLEDQLPKIPLAGLLHSGDIVYNLEDEGGLAGDYFLQNIDPLVSKLPYMFVSGCLLYTSDAADE